MSTPVVSFTDERLPNGLRLIIAEDHLAPVAAVNIWYDSARSTKSRVRRASRIFSST